MFNRKDRLQITKKLKNKRNGHQQGGYINWRFLHKKKQQEKQEKTIEELEQKIQIKEQQPNCRRANQKTWYSLNVALPGSILNNVQTKELRAYITGELARSFAIFCVDEIIIFDETAKIKQKQIDEYKEGNWSGQDPINSNNCECNLFMAKVFEYLECPQYLRKNFFPIHNSLQFAGLLNPLDSMHHLRATDIDLPYREGIVLEKSSKKGQKCFVGLERDVTLINCEQNLIPPNTRVTLKIEEPEGSKKLKGYLTSPKQIREEAGIYWGYSVRIAKCLSEVINSSYDFVIGTSERGTPIEEINIPKKEGCKILIVFGGLNGLESAIESDPNINLNNPKDYFENYINCLPDQGSRIIRTEEAIPICLTALKYKLNCVD
uniref:Uncharacterized protein n=1 Tax=Meloidogyne enterolobii TaxID=390850 RepID=A0A6V7VSL1_MELEN|nr:unnamed protein product [Meloidogyne enterolobii]